MIKDNEIILFKLSQKYKRNIYKVNEGLEDLKEPAHEEVNFKEPISKINTYDEINFKKNAIDKTNGNKTNSDSNSKSNTNNLDFKTADDYKDSFSFFDNNQYIIIKNQNLALHFSEKYKEKIKNNEIVGLKSFDGNYYVISFELLSEIKNKILNLKMSSTFNIEELSSKLSLDKDVTKITLEILKEECLVIEKKKNLFQFV